jgi:hypothetical protein
VKLIRHRRGASKSTGAVVTTGVIRRHLRADRHFDVGVIAILAMELLLFEMLAIGRVHHCESMEHVSTMGRPAFVATF